jgi:lysozyme
MLAFHEGIRQIAYKDSMGLLTIGIGHLLNAVRDARLPVDLREAVKSRRLTLNQCEALFEIDLKEHRECLEQYYPWINDLDEVRKAVLIDMAFNMGPAFLAGWPNFVLQLQHGNWAGAATNMRASLWAKQVKSRAVRLADMMATGEWPTDVPWGDVSDSLPASSSAPTPSA